MATVGCSNIQQLLCDPSVIEEVIKEILKKNKSLEEEKVHLENSLVECARKCEIFAQENHFLRTKKEEKCQENVKLYMEIKDLKDVVNKSSEEFEEFKQNAIIDEAIGREKKEQIDNFLSSESSIAKRKLEKLEKKVQYYTNKLVIIEKLRL